jgi:hypothetical protein
MRFRACLSLLILLPCAASLRAADPVAAGHAFFEKKIQPILASKCFSCHSVDAQKNKKLRAGLFLDTKEGLRQGGDNGTIVIPGDSKSSSLLRALQHEGHVKMPPKEKLAASIISDFATWIDMGAPDPREAKVAASKPTPTRAAKGAVIKKGVVETAKIVDEDISRKLSDIKIQPAPISDDDEFLRRAFLDITGRIPTAKQAAAFLDSKAPDKRSKLIEQLLDSPQYGEQFGRLWRDWIAPAELPSEGNGGNQPIKATRDLGKWFGERFNKNEGWDQIVQKVLTVDGSLKEQPQGLFFSLIGDDQGRPEPAGSARAISSLFLGLQLQCAECHNDPFKEWKQADFWGLAAFFRNTKYSFAGRYFDTITESFEINNKGKKAVALKDNAPNGSITIPKAAFKNSGTVIPAKFVAASEPLKVEPKQLLRPMLAQWLTSAENPYFAKAFVNRTWAYFFARGFIHPMDDMREANPPSHAAALERLTDEFIASGFDVKHLVRCITTTQAYQRTSRPVKEKDKNPATVAAFARMPIKLMSADVLYDSLRLSLNDPGLDLRGYDPKAAQKFGESSPVGDAYGEFVRLFTTNEDDPTEFTHGIPQFLALLNHPNLRNGGKTIEALLKADKPTENVETLYLGTLSRRPTSTERKEALEFLNAVKDKRRAWNVLLWTLLNRSEFLLVR